MFGISFYIFSLFLSYSDYKKYLVPNYTLLALFLFLLSYGFLENRLTYFSFITAFLVLLFFIVLILILPKMRFGGGDIKYIVLVALFLEPLQFAYFLVITGLLQFIYMVYVQLINKNIKTAMVPTMFVSVIITQQLFLHNIIKV